MKIMTERYHCGKTIF